MSYVIYDLETSGLDPAWNVPLQAALLHTDAELKPLGELSLRCRLPAHIVPAPGALLTTGIRPEASAVHLFDSQTGARLSA